ncbi:MAG TPA: tail fiber protein [Solimonas sp.]|nr:tail fiber protein [Solimonas sp.]
MAEPFISEIRLFSFSFPPKSWALCNGQLLPINQNQALFSLLGTTYGGDGRVNFALPDLRGRVPMHVGGNHTLGERAGAQAHTLSVDEMPAHVHNMMVSAEAASTANPANALPAITQVPVYRPGSGSIQLAGQEQTTVGSTGGQQAHLNLQPFLGLSFCIALQGIFPSRN